jgi:hypothetical protein
MLGTRNTSKGDYKAERDAQHGWDYHFPIRISHDQFSSWYLGSGKETLQVLLQLQKGPSLAPCLRFCIHLQRKGKRNRFNGHVPWHDQSTTHSSTCNPRYASISTNGLLARRIVAC